MKKNRVLYEKTQEISQYCAQREVYSLNTFMIKDLRGLNVIWLLTYSNAPVMA